MRRGLLALAAALTTVTVAPPAAQAAFPGANGKIAFDREQGGGGNREIYVMNADGSGQDGLTDVVNFQLLPAWSPDGQRIAYARESDDNSDDEIYVMNANGSGQTNLTTGSMFDFAPAWSPDGQKIAFQGFRDGDHEIFVMNATPARGRRR